MTNFAYLCVSTDKQDIKNQMFGVLDRNLLICSRKIGLAASMLFGMICSTYATTTIAQRVNKKVVEHSKLLTLSVLLKPMTPDTRLLGLGSLSYTFSGCTTATCTINNIQLCGATDNTCSNCNTSPLTITTGTAISYSNSGTSYGISPASIAAYLNYSGVGEGTYNIGLYVQSAQQNCSSSTAYCSSNQDNTNHLLCMQATYNSGSVTALAQTDTGIAPLNMPATPLIAAELGVALFL